MQLDSRLRWKCRRGMLELDLLLEQFLDKQYLQLDTIQRDCFLALLEESDQLLFEWFTGKHQPVDPETNQIVALIRTS